MDFDIGRNEHAFARTLGVIAGLALAALLATLSLLALSPSTGTNVGISLMFAAIGLGVPLFLGSPETSR